MKQADVLDQLHADMQTVHAIAEQGDDSAIPRVIEYHFTALTEEGLRELLRVGELLGFEASECQAAGEGLHSADLITQERIEVPDRVRDSILMLALAEAFGCSYDGWGTFVMRDDDG